MSKSSSTNKLLNTLGFFFQGVPVIFIKSDITLRVDPLLNEYLANYRKSKGEPNYSLDFSNERLCRGYESVITTAHELRHFHDALLSKSLFELFLLQAKRNLYVAQLSKQIRVSPGDLPMRVNEKSLGMSPEAIAFVQEMARLGARYQAWYGEVWSKGCWLGKTTINLKFLLETNGVLSELIHLIVDHGIPAAEEYYENIIFHLPLEYSYLLGYVKDRCGKLLNAISILYITIPFCLYGADNPTEEFASLITKFENNLEGLHGVCNPDSLKECFRNEQSLHDRISKIRLLSSAGEISEPPDFLRLHTIMYECRKTLIHKYVKEFNYNGQVYCERLFELPTPPILFFPDRSGPSQNSIVGVPEGELKRHKTDYYVIRGQGGPLGDSVVLAGLMAVPGSQPSISFGQADWCLASRYFYSRLFENAGILYSDLVDEVYERVFTAHFVDKAEGE